MFGVRVFCAIFMLGGPVHAQDWSAGAVMRKLETPAHERLMARVGHRDTPLTPFATDGCSGGLSEAWRVVANRFPAFEETHQSAPPWESCCVTHDATYHTAGGALDASASFEARLIADLALKACVTATGQDRVDALVAAYQVNPDQIAWAFAAIADAMYVAVRIGGRPCSGLTWRWGYGYPACSVFAGPRD